MLLIQLKTGQNARQSPDLLEHCFWACAGFWEFCDQTFRSEEPLRVRAAHFGNFIGKGRERKGIKFILIMH